MSFSTPWGPAHKVVKHSPGIVTVTTASHGGMMITADKAEKHLSQAAIDCADKHAGYYCFEEHNAYAVAMFDMDDELMNRVRFNDAWNAKTTAEKREYLLETLNAHFPEYLLKKGIQPKGKAYDLYLLRKKRDEAEKNRDPSLIITVYNDMYTLVDGVYKIETADGKEHYVTGESYRTNARKDEWAIYSTINELDMVDPTNFPPVYERLKQYAIDKATTTDQCDLDLDCKLREVGWTIEVAIATTNEHYLRGADSVPHHEHRKTIKQILTEIAENIRSEFKVCRVFSQYGV